MSIQDRIRHRRKQLGLTLQDIADRCGVTWQAVQRWETSTAPKRSNLIIVANALQVSIEWLVIGKGPLSPQAAIDFSKLSGHEAQLVMYFRSMSESDKQVLLNLAHKLSEKSVDEFGGLLLSPRKVSSTATKKKKSS